MQRQIDIISAFALLSALGVFVALVALATEPRFTTNHHEQFSSAMRGESNGETGVGPAPEAAAGSSRSVEDI